jgi:hypothetical protein
MAFLPGWYAVPGSIWPGGVQPGRPGPASPYRPDAVFSLGIPSFRWAAGSAQQDWETGVPYGV